MIDTPFFECAALFPTANYFVSIAWNCPEDAPVAPVCRHLVRSNHMARLAAHLLLGKLALGAGVPSASWSRPTLKGWLGMFKVVRYVAAVVIVAALGPAIDAASSQEEAGLFQSTVLCAFEERLAQYAALHRKLEAPLPLKPSVSAYALSVRREYLANAIKNARPTTSQGEFFTPDVAPLFRDLIDKALTGRDAEAMLNDLYDDHVTPPG
ncbi:MAG TPA: hypothetical protein VEV86_01635, partial [Vicinamibacterales bacterium]|nr:hypothetical protein [Vicinamibacterales bacterium]